jgi:hypothetical protein
VSTLQPRELSKRIRQILVSQRDRLQNYLSLLELEERDIIDEDPDRLNEHLLVESQIIDELSSFQKILSPLQEMYELSPERNDEMIEKLKNSVSRLCQDVKEKSTENKEKLDTLMVSIKARLEGHSKNKMLKSSYNSVESRVLDVSG